MEQSRDPLDAAVAAMRGILRYRNSATLMLVADLVSAVDEAAAMLDKDIATLGAMVLVDPDFEPLWKRQMEARRNLLARLLKRTEVVRAASRQAKTELGQPTE